MGAIWNDVTKEHTIIVEGKNIGLFNAIDRIKNSPIPAPALETVLNALYRAQVRKVDKKVTFHIYDKVSSNYILCIHDSSVMLPNNWWISD